MKRFPSIKAVALFSALVLLAIAFLAAPSKLLDSVLPRFALEEPPLEHLEDLPDIPEPDVLPPPNNNIDELIITLGNINDIFLMKGFDIIKKNLYNIDRTAYVYDSDLDIKKLLAADTKVDLRGNEPKILIFHTHSQEAFADSREGEASDLIIGVGEVLAEILADVYGVSVLHHKGVYDMVGGKVVRGGSYEAMERGVSKILEDNPSIEVMIDLHRDSLPSGRHLVADVNGRQTAMIMFFNGICRLNENGQSVPTSGLVNNYIYENLALSLKMKLLANEMYPGFTRKNYIKPYRYSLHMRPHSLLIEVGSDANTVKEAKNAMAPLADMLIRVFS